MPKRVSEEQRVMEYFDSAPLAKVEVMLDLIKVRVKSRQKYEGAPAAPKATRASKANGKPKSGPVVGASKPPYPDYEEDAAHASGVV